MSGLHHTGERRENNLAHTRIFRNWILIVLPVLLLPAIPAVAQELRISSASGTRGKTVSIAVALTSKVGAEPSALEWEIRAPAGQLEPEPERATVAKRAAKAGKSLRCAVREDSTLRCILAGGRKAIPNGELAKLYFRIPAGAIAGDAQVRVVKGEAVTSDSRRAPIPTAESWIRIRVK
jgi:hypothetical protein